MTDLWVRLVGTLAVSRGGTVHIGGEVGSRKARLLLALLALEGGRPVPADSIVDSLWAGEPPRRAAEGLATLVSRLRGTFGQEIVAGGREGYRLGRGVGTDLREAATRIAVARRLLDGGRPVAALACARRALELLGDVVGRGGTLGRVLADLPDGAVTRRAAALHTDLLRQARHAAAAAGPDAGDHATAVCAARAAVAADALDEVACRLLMRAHLAAGEAGYALAAYEELRDALADALGCDPAPMTRDLHTAALRAGRLRPAPAWSDHGVGVGG